MSERIYRAFSLNVVTINGKILRCPELFYFRCEWPKPLGIDVVRQFDQNECILSKKVFLFYYVGDVFGTLDVRSVAAFNDYMNNACAEVCIGNLALYGSCLLDIYGCSTKLFQ